MISNFPFLPPADWHDFTPGSPNDLALVEQWNTNLAGFTSQGIIGNPWTADGAFPPTPNYFNPADNDPTGQPTTIAQILWNVFPGRILGYNPAMPPAEAFQLADTGTYENGTFPEITSPCTGVRTQFGPFGPRGWQDEYCEWSVQYDPGTTNIRRIDFTCENPEYWNTLWMTDPQMVLRQYQSVLNNPNITMDDLVLKYAPAGDVMPEPVIDPGTGKYVYNPLNKWNFGPQTTFDENGTVTAGGAMHLTSTPNTIQTEIGLGSNATVQRTSGNTNLNTLICCGQFGQIFRNSDPNIGGTINRDVNQASSPVGSDCLVTLTNPPGLYIQRPDYTLYSMNGDPSFNFATCFTVKRGYLGSDTNLPASLAAINSIIGTSSDFILHLTFEVPSGKNASDITINNILQNLETTLQWGGQVAATINNQILATAYDTSSLAAPIPCVGNAGQSCSQPVQLFHQIVFEAMYSRMIPNPVSSDQPLLSNSTYIAPLASPGNTYTMVLVTSLVGTPSAITFYDGAIADTNIAASITGTQDNITYAVPGNTYPSSYTALTILVRVSNGAALGVRGIAIDTNPIMPALLNVVVQPA
jgi:hypothetical protein